MRYYRYCIYSDIVTAIQDEYSDTYIVTHFLTYSDTCFAIYDISTLSTYKLWHVLSGIYIGTRSGRAQPASLLGRGRGGTVGELTELTNEVRCGAHHPRTCYRRRRRSEAEQETKGGANAKSRPSPDKLGKMSSKAKLRQFSYLVS